MPVRSSLAAGGADMRELAGQHMRSQYICFMQSSSLLTVSGDGDLDIAQQCYSTTAY